jgi:hypothetical protein
MDVTALGTIWTLQTQVRAATRRRGLTLVLAVAALPSATLLAVLGFAWGRSLPGLDPADAGRALAALLGGLALLSAFTDGTCALRLEAFQPFRIRPWTLFQAELLVGAATPVKMAIWAAGGAFALGAAAARPVLAPWLALSLPLLVLALLALERMAGVLTRRFGHALRILVIFGAGLAGMRALLGALMGGANLKGTPTGQHLAALPLPGAGLPTTWLVSSFRHAALRGWPGPGLLAFLGAWAGLLALAYGCLRPDLLGERPALGRVPAKPRTFRHPWATVAWLHLGRVLGSKPGRFMFFLPIVALTSLVDPLVFGFRPGPTWVLAWAAFMLVPPGRKLASNLFGLDRGGVRTFWLLPLEDRDLLLGKALATGFVQAMVGGLTLFCLALATPLRPLELLGGALLLAALALFHSGTGLRRSLEHPFPLDPAGLNPAVLDDPTLATFGLLLLPCILLIATWGLTLRLGTPWALLAMALAVPLGALHLRRSYRRAVDALPGRREALTLALEGSEEAGA